MPLLQWLNPNKFDVLRDKVNAIVNLLNKGRLIPIGSILPWYGDPSDIGIWDVEYKGVPNTEMEGFAVCLGQALTVNGEVIYNVPALQNRFLFGAGENALGAMGGESTVTLTGRQSGLRAHIHTESQKATGSNGSGFLNFPSQGNQNLFEQETSFPKKVDGINGNNIDTPTEITNGLPALDAHNNLPPFFALYYIIRYK